jgi:hypothetical protein
MRRLPADGNRMLNKDRHSQFVALMQERGWDLLVFYGDSWLYYGDTCLQGPKNLEVL